jgi:phospholipid-translocating ATPase
MAVAESSPEKRRPGGLTTATAGNGYSYARFHDQAIALRDDVFRRVVAAIAVAYQHTIVELILRRKHIEASKDGRHIPLRIEHDSPLMDTRRGHSYLSNSIRTSRYTIWDFVPKQLFFQFSRVGNFYFLCVGIPQMVGSVRTLSTCM